jgi:hypothetical protein
MKGGLTAARKTAVQNIRTSSALNCRDHNIVTDQTVIIFRPSTPDTCLGDIRDTSGVLTARFHLHD